MSGTVTCINGVPAGTAADRLHGQTAGAGSTESPHVLRPGAGEPLGH
ncbi:hypothetical protein GCM10009665_20850 [Kitasatospora nipponensis]|uniref:Uncharacterized protein n=1 Tax=Kitasatospora nipponensis TaxID=258049 RepID=A0ABP4GNM5_9ACTN